MLLRMLGKLLPKLPTSDNDLEPIRLHLTALDGEILASTLTRTIFEIEFVITQAGLATHVRDNKHQKLWTLKEPKNLARRDVFTCRGYVLVSEPVS